MNTRKKAVRTVYRDDESEDEDFSPSESEAEIPAGGSSEDESSSGESSESEQNTKQRKPATSSTHKQKFAARILSRLARPDTPEDVSENHSKFTVKDLTEKDKLLPKILKLSESESSDDEGPAKIIKPFPMATSAPQSSLSDVEEEILSAPHDWLANSNSEEVAKKSFAELQRHSEILQQTKKTLDQYHSEGMGDTADVKDLLALGEGLSLGNASGREETVSDNEDWEEVKDSKLPSTQAGIELIVAFPEAARKSKTVDVEMMMRRKINRVKKEYQVYMHKVHVLSWLAHGNHVNGVLNDQRVMASALALLPSEQSYPRGKINQKYLTSLVSWYQDFIRLAPDKQVEKFKPDAPPLHQTLLEQMKRKIVTSYKILYYVFVSLLRSMGIQCRLMLNFVTVPIRPLSTELCSLSTKKTSKPSTIKSNPKTKPSKSTSIKSKASTSKNNTKSKLSSKGDLKSKLGKSSKSSKIEQLDGAWDSDTSMDWNSGASGITQFDGNDDSDVKPVRRNARRLALKNKQTEKETDQDESPLTRSKNEVPKNKTEKGDPVRTTIPGRDKGKADQVKETRAQGNGAKSEGDRSRNLKHDMITRDVIRKSPRREMNEKSGSERNKNQRKTSANNIENTPTTRSKSPRTLNSSSQAIGNSKKNSPERSKIEMKSKSNRSLMKPVSSEFFSDSSTSKNAPIPSIVDFAVSPTKAIRLSLRKRGRTSSPSKDVDQSPRTSSSDKKARLRTKSVPVQSSETSQYFRIKSTKNSTSKRAIKDEDSQRVSHKDLLQKSPQKRLKLDVTEDLKDIIKTKIKEAKHRDALKKVERAKGKTESSDDSDYLPEESNRRCSADDFKQASLKTKKVSSRRKINRSVLSSDEDDSTRKKGFDVWCEVYVEEGEQWISVDLMENQLDCTDGIYKRAAHPVAYVVGWDNSGRLKDLTRRYVPNYNTATRKLRVDEVWWRTALKPWLPPPNPRDKKEDDQLEQIMFDKPLPKSIAEYKNHPLYALKRHQLKFEALYPPDAPPLGYVRGEPVYARACVHVCRSRDTWLKEAKTVRPNEKPYKIVKARPKWDRLSNRLINDIPLELFGPWQVEDYVPPRAVDGVVPRNAYGNVELFKSCMLPGGTVHLTLPGLNKVARKLNIDCAAAMTGFDFHGGWTHPVFDGFVVCEEFQEILTDAWVKEQEESERREREKIEARVYGNWKKLIRGLLIRERLRDKYDFPAPAPEPKKGPRLLIKKK